MRRVPGSLALGAALLAASCGQKGPLYLPDKSVPMITTPAQPTPAQPAAPQSPPVAAPPSGTAPKPEDKNHDPESPK
jgi:predicted small lipoprotein YifL